MRLTVLFTIPLLLLCLAGIAQAPPADEQVLIQLVSNSKSDLAKSKAMLDLGEYYRSKPGEESKDMQAAHYYLSGAAQLAAGKSQDLMDQIVLARSKTYMELMQLDSAETMLLRMKGQKMEMIHNYAWISHLYLFKPGADPADIAHSHRIVRYITELGKQMRSRAIYNQGLYYQGEIYIETQEWGKYRQVAQLMHFAMASEHYRRAAELFRGNIGWHRPFLDSTLTYAALCVIAAKTGGEEPLSNDRMGYFITLMDEYKYDPPSERALLYLLNAYNHNKWRGSHLLMAYLSDYYSFQGNLAQSIYYAEEAVKNMEKERDLVYVGVHYLRLGNLYRSTGAFEKALAAYNRSRNYFNNERSKPSVYTVVEGATIALRKMQRYDEALALLQKTLTEAPLKGDFETSIYYRAMANIYRDMKRYAEAEPYILKLLDIAKKDSAHIFSAFHAAGQLYTEWGQYDKAHTYLSYVLKRWPAMNAGGMAHMQFMMFRVDSARGDYVSAINHLLINKSLDDSMLTDTKVKQLAALQVQYETEKKDKDLLLQQQNIALLRKQQELGIKDLQQTKMQLRIEEDAQKQALAMAQEAASNLQLTRKNMELMKKDNLLQQSYLRQSNIIRNVTIAGIILSLLVMGLLYYQYRSKQKINKEISYKNDRLEHLVKEKEWLLQEVHHRVKNNLQTVVSLLESQATYLNDSALQALKESRNRVYAMSLIHQKLYQETNVSSIRMADYLPELIEHLRTSFTTSQQIRFDVHIEDVEVDISQAIPLGLILNEAITNSIKYAFPKPRPGHDQIQISLATQVKGNVALTIADNGIGLPQNLNPATIKSLGLKLIHGLAGEIDGNLTISGTNGTRLQVIFTPTLLMQLEKQDLSVTG